MEKIKKNLKESLFIIENYDWLLSSNILDFYVNDDWNQKLLLSWRNFFDSSCFELEELNKLILPCISSKKVWPLSLLSLKTVLDKLNIPRSLTDLNESNPSITNHPKLKQIFTKHVKPKKRHEVEKMSRVCKEVADELGIEYIVDFGAGLGHLSRVLAYGYGLKVCCLEQNAELTKQAGEIDLQLERTVLKYLPSEILVQRPVHLNIKLTKATKSDDFIKWLKASFKIKETSEFSFGIVGLHPCGDLAATLLKMFLDCKEAKFINLVGCCYMKLSSEGYPLSKFLKNQRNSNLSYEAREISCHALELYSERLIKLDYSYLRIHSYRAVLEKILVGINPELKHSGLKSVKYQKGLTFSEYVMRTCENLKIQISEKDLNSVYVQDNIEKWKQVVIFYTLRLIIAPLVESVLLNDRQLYLIEEGCLCEVRAIFDPVISSRNHVINARKLSIVDQTIIKYSNCQTS